MLVPQRTGQNEADGAMEQVADWLAKLGMGQYARRFAENDIDFSALRFLTDQDLEKLGVPLGHRRKMLAVIAEIVPTTAHQINRQTSLIGATIGRFGGVRRPLLSFW